MADPWDRPMTPSYWFFDSSSDHHATWVIQFNLPHTVYTNQGEHAYRFLPSIIIGGVKLEVPPKDPPRPRTAATGHGWPIDIMQVRDVRQLVAQGYGVSRNGGSALDVSVDNWFLVRM